VEDEVRGWLVSSEALQSLLLPCSCKNQPHTCAAAVAVAAPDRLCTQRLTQRSKT
jgi:hypothetical protein